MKHVVLILGSGCDGTDGLGPESRARVAQAAELIRNGTAERIYITTAHTIGDAQLANLMRDRLIWAYNIESGRIATFPQALGLKAEIERFSAAVLYYRTDVTPIVVAARRQLPKVRTAFAVHRCRVLTSPTPQSGDLLESIKHAPMTLWALIRHRLSVSR